MSRFLRTKTVITMVQETAVKRKSEKPFYIDISLLGLTLHMQSFVQRTRLIFHEKATALRKSYRQRLQSHLYSFCAACGTPPH